MADSVRSIGTGRQHSTIQLWYTNWLNTGSSFAGGVDNEVGEIHGNVVESTQTVFATGKTTSSGWIHIRATYSGSGVSVHDGVWDETKAYVSTPSDNGVIDNLGGDPYIAVYDLQFEHNNTGNEPPVDLRVGPSDIYRCIVNGKGVGQRGLYVYGSNVKAYRNIFMDMGSHGMFINDNVVQVVNNTCINCVEGIDGNDTTFTLTNNYCGANSTGDFTACGNTTFSGNLSSDSSCPDGASRQGKNDYTSYFLDYNNDNFHLKSTDTVLKDAGIDQVSPYDYDIDNEQATVSGSWDVGADEYVGTTIEDVVLEFSASSSSSESRFQL
jgi:hypothetical protein